MAEEKAQKQPTAADIIEGEVLAEYSDQTLLNLPSIDDEPEPEAEESSAGPGPTFDAGRRGFVMQLLLGSGAALALGGSAALWLARQNQQPTTVVVPNGVELPSDVNPSDLAEMAGLVASLQAELETVSAERDQLLLDLDDVQRALVDAQALNELWRQHDEIGLDDLLAVAFGALTGLIGGLISSGTTLLQNLTSVDETVAAFVAKLPGPRDGVRWLGQQVSGLASALSTLKETIKSVVSSSDPVTTMVTDFVRWILDRLPFGAGNSASAGLDAMEALINSIPAHVDGLNTSVLNPLADWFGDAAEKNLTGVLIDPVLNLALSPARSFAEGFAAFNEAYQTQLVSPVETALNARESVKQEIRALQARLETERTA